jgi:hypothetical protein
LFFSSLLSRRESFVDNRVLGAIAMICAPALLVEEILRQGEANALITGIVSMVFMAGWICSNIGMQQMRATGTGTWGRAVLLIQLIGLVLAFIFGFIEATALLDENNIVFIVTDAAWPLSMLWMLVVGITVIRAKRLSGWQRFIPVLCPLWLPLAALGWTAFGDAGSVIGFVYSTVLWILLGYVVFLGGEHRHEATPTPNSSVQ